jgi:DNA-directed RNA polymerase alpha subunit
LSGRAIIRTNDPLACRNKAEGDMQMTGDKKSTDPGLSNAERKALRGNEARDAMSDHEDTQKAFHENRERLREARLAREAVAGPMFYPALELPDDTLIENVRFSSRIQNALNAAGVQTIGDIREASDARLLSFHDLGAGSVAHLRKTLGAPPKRRVRPIAKL